MNDQAQELRNLMSQATPPATAECALPKLIAIAGGKGGVGATTLAVLLARGMTNAGQRVVLVDGEGNRENMAMFCGVVPTATTDDVFESNTSLEDALQPGPEGMLLLPGAWRDRSPKSDAAHSNGDVARRSPEAMERFVAGLQRLNPITDFVIVDAGSGGESCVWRPLWQVADASLIVTTTESVAVMDCYSLMKQLVAGGTRNDFHIIVNQAPSSQLAADVQQRLAASCRRFLGVPLAFPGWLPLDSDLCGAPNICHQPVEASGKTNAYSSAARIADQLLMELCDSPSHRIQPFPSNTHNRNEQNSNTA